MEEEYGIYSTGNGHGISMRKSKILELAIVNVKATPEYKERKAKIVKAIKAEIRPLERKKLLNELLSKLLKEKEDFLLENEDNINGFDGLEMMLDILTEFIEKQVFLNNKIVDLGGDTVTGKEKLASKQQILLLSKLGVFGSPSFKKLPIGSQGKLISYLLNRDEKNITDYLRYFGGKNVKAAHNCKTEKNIAVIDNLLKEVGMA